MQFDIEALLNLHRSIFGDARMDDPDDDADAGADDGADDPDEPDAVAAKAAADALGDPGKQALDRMKDRLKAERARRIEAEKKVADAAKPKPPEGQPDLEALRNEARQEARAEQLKDRALDKIEAKASRLFKDPEDAVLRLGRNIDDFIDDGKVDTDAIVEALDELLKTRPDFAIAAPGERQRFGDADAGPRGKPTGAKPQLTEADVKRLSAEGKHVEIEAARVDGRLNDLLGIKT